MGRDVVAHAIGVEVGSAEHNAALGQGYIPNAMLQDYRQQHIHHRSARLTQLIEHEYDRLCLVTPHTEPSIRCIRCGHVVSVNDGHTQVTEVEVGYIYVADMVVREILTHHLKDA